MINYFKLHFNYLFSKVFVILFFLILLLMGLGIYFSVSIDLGVGYIDGFRYEYYFEYLDQSLLIVQVIVVIFSMFIAALLGSKANEFLLCFTVSNYQEKIMFLLSRILVLITVVGLLIIMGGLNILMIGIIFTPFNLDIRIILEGLGFVFLQALFYQGLVGLLLSVVNSLLVVILPIIVFWLHKSIVSFVVIENDLQKIILKMVPSFIIENGKIFIYKTAFEYMYLILTLLLVTIFINLIKDCR